MKKTWLAALATSALMALAPMTVFAATKLTSASITIEGSFEEGTKENEVSVSEDSAQYDVVTAKVTNTPKDGWEVGDKPKIKVTLKCKKNYEWNAKAGSIDVEGMDGTVSNVSNSGKKLTFTFTADDIGEDSYDGDLNVSSVSVEDGIVSWDAAEDATKYEVKLYRGSKLLKTQKTSAEEYDFSDQFTQSGTYSAKVRAIKGNHKGSYTQSDEYTVTSEEASEIRADYKETSEKKKSSASQSNNSGEVSSTNGPSVPKDAPATEETGPSPADAINGATAAEVSTDKWMDINGTWYYYQAATNTFAVNQYINGADGKTYYVDATGAMLANSYTPDLMQFCGADGALMF